MKRREYFWSAKIDLNSIAVKLIGVKDETANDIRRSAEVIEIGAALARLASKRGPVKKDEGMVADAAA